jgi:hypothetical protein
MYIIENGWEKSIISGIKGYSGEGVEGEEKIAGNKRHC